MFLFKKSTIVFSLFALVAVQVTTAIGKARSATRIEGTDSTYVAVDTSDRTWTVVYFWSTSCPCVRRCEQGTLFPLWRKYKDKGVRFYALASNASNIRYVPSVGSQGKTTEKATLSLPGPLEGDDTPPYSILVDSHHEMADKLHATHTAETFLIDPKGCVVFHGDPDDSAEQLVKTGHERVTRHYLASAIERALAGKKVIVPVSGTFGCEIDRSDVPDDAERSEKKGNNRSGNSR